MQIDLVPFPSQVADYVRLGYAADLPTPGELVQTMTSGGGSSVAPGNGGSPAPKPSAPRRSESAESLGDHRPRAFAGAAAPMRRPAPEPEARSDDEPKMGAVEPTVAEPIESFEQAVALFAARREAVLNAHLRSHVHLVHFEPGRIEIHPTSQAPAHLANRMGELLGRWTGQRWVVTVSKAPGQPTLEEQERAQIRAAHERAAADPLVRAVLETFPGASIERVRERAAPPPPVDDATNEDEAS